MVKLELAFVSEIRPIPPYNFELTIHKPAGWASFTPSEVYEGGTMWTATHIDGNIIGLKLRSKGTLDNPRVIVEVFMEKRPNASQLRSIDRSITRSIGAAEDLTDFYAMAMNDDVLKHTVQDLRGMHNTYASTIFPDAVLAITLQMTTIARSNQMMDCLLNVYGDLAEFDGRNVHTWPRPSTIAAVPPEVLAKTCNMGYRAKHMVRMAKKIQDEGFPSTIELESLSPEEAKKKLLSLPGIGDYSADIINPHGGFPIDVWSADVFGLLLFGREPVDKNKEIQLIKSEGIRRWGKWSWMSFYYVVQDLENLSRKLGLDLRLI
jgi:3-methyladenine DNA glycosylase/8-oxoguanine DNA glycosylase